MEWNFFTVNTGATDFDWQFLINLLPILIPLMVVSTVLMVVSIVSVVRKPNPWNEKIGWLLLIILVDVIGPVIYFAVGVSQLEQKNSEREDRENINRGGNL
jgi:hypothetical protein